MSKGKNKRYSGRFKAKVAFEAISQRKTITELCSEFGVAAPQIYAWKKKLEEGAESFFADKRQEKGDKKEIERRQNEIFYPMCSIAKQSRAGKACKRKRCIDKPQKAMRIVGCKSKHTLL